MGNSIITMDGASYTVWIKNKMSAAKEQQVLQNAMQQLVGQLRADGRGAVTTKGSALGGTYLGVGFNVQAAVGVTSANWAPAVSSLLSPAPGERVVRIDVSTPGTPAGTPSAANSIALTTENIIAAALDKGDIVPSAPPPATGPTIMVPPMSSIPLSTAKPAAGVQGYPTISKNVLLIGGLVLAALVVGLIVELRD